MLKYLNFFIYHFNLVSLFQLYYAFLALVIVLAIGFPLLILLILEIIIDPKKVHKIVHFD